MAAPIGVVAPAAALPAAAETATGTQAATGPSTPATPATPTPAGDFPPGVSRLAGASRYETAVAVSQRFAPGVPAVFLATGTDFPDALPAAAAAAHLGGPLLLTPSTGLPDPVAAELKRLRPAVVFIAGGTAVVGSAVEKAVRAIAPTERLAGSTRYGTAEAIDRRAFDSADQAIVATGRDFPDALAASGAAGARHAPIILVDGVRGSVPTSTLALVSRLGVRTAAIAGGTAVVSSGIQSQLGRSGVSVTRYAGASRFETSALLNSATFAPGSSTAEFLATGMDYPDALAGGALAGALEAPLALSSRSCVDPAVGDQLTALGAASTIALGSTAVLADSAARAARCVHPIVTEPLVGWATTGWTPNTTVPAPYSDRPPVDVNSPSIKLDSTGLLIYNRVDTHTRADHPVAYAQYGISALLEYKRTGQKVWLDRAIRQADRLVAIRTESRGAWWYPYSFPWTYYSRTLTAPWWSGMAQGEALSLFVRLAETTGDARWNTAADKTFASFTVPHSSTAPWASLVIDKHLYFEEYAGNQPPLLVLNGHVFALFGLYDYWKHTGSALALRYFDGGASTVLDRMMPLVRLEGGVSYYCVQYEYCQVPAWQNPTYHVIHSWQLDTLARLTGDDAFTTWADLLRSDWVPGSPRSLNGSNGTPTPDQAPDLGTW
ncbi:cell wall-binding repeat-containing protein [uncultured Leifsonia sp.]|uniref:cell wall-binding repeat-containing protein n=1 Tax=uncultured Leifsonia sp. TaxID=340359 RepID=UPI0028D88687|nr:cell wall-binding repeat-containing protein [uncultured Leifsonia sp.]